MRIRGKADKAQYKYPVWVFLIITISFPFLLLFCIEILLRLFNVGSDVNLFIRSDQIEGHLVMNPEVSKRYFANPGNSTRGLQEEFSEIKQDNTIRIFIQGESSAVGFPYLNNGSFHRMLKYRLQREYPDTRFEIINLGLTAVCSFTLLDFAKEIIAQKPDAILIYAGHNEYVGAMGIGSSMHYNSNRLLVQSLIALRKLRTARVFTDWMQKAGQSEDNLYGKNLMQRMADDQQIPYGSSSYQAGVQQFQKNMTKLLTEYRKANIPVFIADLVANDKDLPPFKSIPGSAYDTKFLELLESADQRIQNQEFEQAITYLQQAQSIDSSHAGTQFLLGRTCFALGQYDKARLHFIRARNFDLLRFRAPEAFNEIIKDIAVEQGACFVPVKEIFESFSSGGIVGDELMTEHVHPNLEGYSLIAKAFHDSLVASNLFQNRHKLPYDEETFASEMPLTEMDSLYGHYNIVLLKNGWPFFQPGSVNLSADDPLHTRLAKEIVLNKTNWLAAMDEIYMDAVRRKDHLTGLKVSEALHLEFPYDIRFLDKAAHHAMVAGKAEKGAFYFSKAFETTKSPNYAKQALIAFLKCDKPEIALRFIPTLTAIKNEGKLYQSMYSMIKEIIDFKSIMKNSDSQVVPKVLIARNYYLMGNFAVAEHYAKEAFELDPSNTDAKLLIENILKQQDPI